ncbi:Nuclear transport factor 2 [Thelotrema lepadinum]|nr:Nuclear transport factor 2 [Thelotrema lepadinum]
MADYQGIAKQFVEFYYQTFDQNRPNLAALYRDQSMLTFESSAVQGVSSIVEKLTALPFEKIVHRVDTSDAQPSGPNGEIIVMVTGALLIDAEQRPMSYVQVFNLMPEAGSYFVYNDMFKLVYPAA